MENLVAAQNVYADNMEEYEATINKYAATLNSPYQTRWELKYFAAQSYLDLYTKTNDIKYLKKAYVIAKDNVNTLSKKQEELNDTYIQDIKEGCIINSASC